MAINKKRKSDSSPNRTFARLFTNLSSGISSDKNGEKFISFCIDFLAEKDQRTQRFVMCDLLMAGLQHSERYATHYEEMKKLFAKATEAQQI